MSLIYKEEPERFCIMDNNKEIAEMTFSRVGQDKATINHTFVDLKYRGKGLADKLLELTVKKLTEEHREIIPICSFAAKKLKK